MRRIETPVLVVGAGPVGLAVATDLGWRNVGCLIVDKSADQAASINVHPRAAAITPRTMEFCRKWGLAEDVRDAGFPKDYPFNVVYCTSLDGHLIAIQHYPSILEREPLAASPETRERCPQIWFDPILERGLARYPSVQVRRSWQLLSFADEGGQVRARLRVLDTQEQVEVVCRYLIGCDGPTSFIRETLGVTSTGSGLLSNSINAVLDIPNFLDRHKMGPAERYLFQDHRGTWANLTVVDGRTRWRFTLTGSQAELDPSKVDLAGPIRRVLGPDIPYKIVAVAPWRRREAIANQFKVGRVFLAGDAAHTIPPNLGMGMNTGLGDAIDLGWKIEAMLAGWGGADLLESYEIERRPVAVRTAAASTKAYRLWMSPIQAHEGILAEGEVGAAAREAVGAHMRRVLPDGWDTLNLQLGYRYDDSPLCVPDGTPPPGDDDKLGDYHPTARPGSRAPHAWLEDGRSVLDLFGDGFVLLRFTPDHDVALLSEAAAAVGLPLRVIDISSREIGTLYAANLVLVRPDGHVAWRSDRPPTDAQQLIDRVRGEPSGETLGTVFP